jgi:putative FmdB family regulatory protein
MPTYDFVCDACGHTFEEWQSFNDEPLTKCPQCKKNKVRRLIGTGAAVVFKGSGFYETDYKRGDDYKAAQKADQAPPPAAESKPAAAPAAASPPPPPPAATGGGKGKKGGK